MKFLRTAYAYSGVAAAAASTMLVGTAHAESLSTNSSIGPTGNSNFNSAANVDFRNSLVNIANTVLNVILLLAGILAVFYLIYSGIQYITSAGNPDKIKSARAGIINAIIGIIIIVAAFFIIRFAVTLGGAAANAGNTTGL